jgi:hypothetical protein
MMIEPLEARRLMSAASSIPHIKAIHGGSHFKFPKGAFINVININVNNNQASTVTITLNLPAGFTWPFAWPWK